MTMTHTITLDDIKADIEEIVTDRCPTAGEVRTFKARLWPLVADWEYVIDDLCNPEITAKGFANERRICALIQLAIEEKDDDGRDPEKEIGRLLVELAARRATAEYLDILDELEPGDPEYGMDVPATQRVMLDRDVA